MIDALSIGFRLDDGEEILVVSVDGPGAVRLDDAVFLLRGRRPNLGHTRPLAQLQRRSAHTAGSAVNEHLVVRTEVAKVMQHVMSRHVGHRR
ncbi:MAG TPA: hypothetical protein D7I11_06760 [Candidatus Poseidoniales archaeon]|nr:MAG TPA: hypothetical protein D7I11_06760 [Candidatus Poseidoniales archaeon]